MDDPALSRSSRAAYPRNPTHISPVDRPPISSNTSPWFTPGLVPPSRNMQDMVENADQLHSRKDLSDDDPTAHRRGRDRNDQRRDQYGAPAGWDWRSRTWIDSKRGASLATQQKLHHHRHRQQENSADDSIDGRISKLRQDANRLVNQRRLATRRISRQSPGWVSDLEGITEKRRRDGYGGETLTRIRREKVGGPRNRRRASQHVLDLHNRRKLMRREYPLRDANPRRSKAEGEIVSALQLLGESIHSSKSFSLQTLEEYLKERAVVRRLQNEDNEGSIQMVSPLQPASYASSGKNADRPCRSVRKGAAMKPIDDTSLGNDAQQLISIYASEDGQDEDSEAQRSGCGISWRWLNNAHSANKDDSSMPAYAGTGCFPAVSKRRIGRRLLVSRHRKGWDKYNSECSFTSFDSDSETVPLMTEPEPFHDYTTDDVAGSSVELDRSLHKELKPKKPSRFKELGRSSNGHSFSKGDCERECREVGLPVRQPDVRPHRSMSLKHRPKEFKDLVGQSMVAQSLSNAVLRSKIAPVYLFQGPRGTGKTCAARIFTAALNCLSAEDLRPCGTCKECLSYNEGKNFDVREVDAAGNNGIESMKLLLKHISLPPSSRYKVFIIDECHLLTADAWNAFLKSLEEPPSYVVFILITTDAEQLPRTALSRCQKFLFSKIKESDIVARLQKIALLERIDVELAALQLIASRSDGSMREAELTLDQISLVGKRATLSVVQEMVGMIPEKKLIEFLEVALSPDTSNTVKAIRDLMESGVEALALISQLATLITDIIAGNNRSAAYRLKQVRRVEDERFRQALKILSDAERQLRSCTDRTTWLTAAFLQFSQTAPSTASPRSRGTSITQSPGNLYDTSEKEAPEGDAKWESLSSPQISERAFRGDHKRGHSQSIPYSGPLVGSKVHPCSHSPKSTTDVDDARKTSIASRPPAIPRGFPSGLNNVEKRQATTNISMDSIWRKIIDNCRSNVIKQLLHGEAKLVSLSVTEALAAAHLDFRHPEHRNVAEKARTSITKAFQEALGCPVDLKITLSSTSAEDIAGRELRSASSLSRNLEQQSKPKKLVPLSNGENKAYYLDEQCLSQEQRSHRSGSFRKSSSSKFGVSVASSPRIRLPEPRKPRQSLEVEENAHSQRYSAELSAPKEKSKESLENRRASVHYGRAPNALSLQNINGFDGDRDVDSQSEDSFEKDSNAEHGFSPAPVEYAGYGVDVDKDGSDSEAQEKYGRPSFLCWKGSRMPDGKGKHQRLRRKRRGRLLLKLVPCANGERRN